MSVARCSTALAVVGAVATLTGAAVLGTVATAAASPTATAAARAAATVAFKVPPASDAHAALRLGGQLARGTDQNILVGTTLPVAGQRTAQTGTPFVLELQDDGNLVEYVADPYGYGSHAVWSTRTTTATRLVFQTDHNVVLRDAAGRTLWTTGTQGTSAATLSVYGNGQLLVQDATGRPVTAVGSALVTPAPGVLVSYASSPEGEYVLLVQEDGNLVEYRRVGTGLRPVWSTGTSGSGPVRLAAQPDGNLVLYSVSTGRAVWNSHSHGAAAYYQLDVQDDANVVLYRTDGVHRLQAVWASYTRV